MPINWKQFKEEYETREKYWPILSKNYDTCDKCGTKMMGQRCDQRCPRCGLIKTCED